MASSSLVAASNVASQTQALPDLGKFPAAHPKPESTKVFTLSQSFFGKMNEKASSALAYTATDSCCGKKFVKLFARTAVFSILTAGATVEAAARAIIGIALKIVGFPLSFCKANFFNNLADATLNSAIVTGQNAKSALGSIFTMSAPKAEKGESKPASSKAINNKTLEEAYKKLKPATPVVKGRPAVRTPTTTEAPAVTTPVEEGEVFETTGRIGQLTDWIADRACDFTNYMNART